MQQEYAYSSGYDESLYAVPPPVVYVSSTRSTSYPFKLLGLTGGFLLICNCLWLVACLVIDIIASVEYSGFIIAVYWIVFVYTFIKVLSTWISLKSSSKEWKALLFLNTIYYGLCTTIEIITFIVLFILYMFALNTLWWIFLLWGIVEVFSVFFIIASVKRLTEILNRQYPDNPYDSPVLYEMNNENSMDNDYYSNV